MVRTLYDIECERRQIARIRREIMVVATPVVFSFGFLTACLVVIYG